MSSRIVAQILLTDRCDNQRMLTIRIGGNEIFYDTGISALSNHMDLTRLPRIHNGQNNDRIIDEALAAIMHDDALVKWVADEPEVAG